MSFDTAWLDLREPADNAARDRALLQDFANTLRGVAVPRIIDLGSGTGSTMRAVASVLPSARWLLTDNDPALLTEARDRMPEAETARVDLASGLSDLLSRDADAITASALIDLVSAAWLDDLVAHAAGRTLYIAINYDGSESWLPDHPDDAAIYEAFQAHQRRDKGFGPALGSDAVPYLSEKLEEAGYHVRTARSPWILSESALLRALAEGVSEAAVEEGVPTSTAARWLDARRSATGARIGHLDLLATMSQDTFK